MYRAPLFLVLVASLVMGQAGCGDSEKKRPTNWPDGIWLPDGSPILDSATIDLGARADLDYDPDGPVITVISPKVGVVVTSSTLTVRAKITDKDQVDQNSVKVTLQGSTATSMTATTTPNEYEAKLDVSSVKGTGRLTISAADLTKKKNSKIWEFKYDSGPTITFTAPGPSSSHKSKVTVQVLVKDTVKITSFKVLIGAQQVALKAVVPGDTQQVWTGDVIFSNYQPPLSGSQVLTAEATNKNGARSTTSLQFQVDDAGPTILITSQTAGTLIGGVIKLGATVTDTAGVLASSVKCVIGNGKTIQTITLKASSTSPNNYTGQFDTRTLLQTFLWPVMSFRATDKLGNEAHNDIQVGLDNGKPIMELDPPEDFHMTKKKQTLTECSRPFDPVGDDAADDLQQVPQVTFIRGRFQDQGNDINSAPWVPISGLDDTTAYIFVLDDTSKALVYDNDGDGWCDDINPEVIPAASKPGPNEAVAVKLLPGTPIGSADFRHPYLSSLVDSPAVDAGTSVGPLPPAGCTSWGGASKMPDPLCPATSMSVMIPYSGSKRPAIYAIPPLGGGKTGYTCSGLPFDFKANKISDGWVCVAATIKDKLGNRGVTPPIRLYVNNSTSFTKPSDTLPGSAGAPPNCTGSMNKATGKVETVKPCKFRNPRQGSAPGLGVYKCDSKMTAKQMYCHNEVLISS